ncbi:MAG: Cytochrome B561-like protein [Gammaproteobacteria bacterium]|nr:Cytochrome B561-like protein [Gammaproteobacteria bacterium]
MDIRNTPTHYGLIAKLFHWIMSLIVICMLCIGLYMVSLPNSLDKLQIYGYHKATGILVLSLVTLRVLWRCFNISPTLAPMPNWQKISAHSLHIALYVFMFAMPLTGWMMSSAAGIPVSFFGLFVLPDLVSPNPTLLTFFDQTHKTLAFILIGMILLHLLAALKHHFINKDDTLRKMIK